MKKVNLLALLVLILCSACSKESLMDEEGEKGEKTVTIRVMNFMQYDLGELTRAEEATALDNLAIAVFDSETGQEIIGMQQQKKGDKDYGNFHLTLPYGTYQLTVLGYNGTRLCNSMTATQVTFAENFVPHTFLANQTIMVNASTEALQTITLHRTVAAFSIHVTDVTPVAVDRMVFTSTGGGTALNPQTGFASDTVERKHTIPVPTQNKGQANNTFNIYTFLPQQSATMTWKVEALNSSGKVLRDHTFHNVPMKINSCSLYEGKFFTDDTFDIQLKVDMEWQDTIKISY